MKSISMIQISPVSQIHLFMCLCNFIIVQIHLINITVKIWNSSIIRAPHAICQSHRYSHVNHSSALSMILSFHVQECYVNKMLSYVTFLRVTFSLSIMPLRLMQVVAHTNSLLRCIAEHHPMVWIYHSLLVCFLIIHLLKDLWVVSSLGLL